MDINDLLRKTVENDASDLHICAGVPPIIRVYGDLINLNEPVLTPHDCVQLAKQCLSSRMYERFLEVGASKEVLVQLHSEQYLQKFRQLSSWGFPAWYMTLP